MSYQSKKHSSRAGGPYRESTADICEYVYSVYIRRGVWMANLIVQSAVKESLDEKNVASDFYDALDEEVAEVLENAARRAEDNGRATVQPRDL